MPVRKVKRVSDSLPCRLTDEERLEFADALAEATQSVEAAENARKSAMKQHNYEIQLAQARRDRIANIVASKTEYRDVTVEEKWDWNNDKFTRTRTDTGELILERRLNDEERQTQLLEDGEQFNEAEEIKPKKGKK